MPKRLLCISFILFLPYFIFAQQSKLNVSGSGNDLYLEHSVTAGENFYSIGRLFNISPREIATYNKISMDKGLNVGQKVRIPLTADNFAQNTSKSPVEALVPLYHTVASGETLYRIGLNHKNVPLENIKSWNQLQGDNVKQGESLIVGFLRVNRSESALASREYNVSGSTVATATPDPKPEVRQPETRQPEKKPEAKSTASTTNTADNSVAETPTPLVKNESSSFTKAGFFQQEYTENNRGTTRKLNGTATVFKSTSGWQDGKYYCFNNNAVPGSIVKINVAGMSEAVYAKVLDAIPDIKQNEGLVLVLSNAAADALGVSGEKFEATIEYTK